MPNAQTTDTPYHFINLIGKDTPDTFASDISAGLSATEKHIHHKYMYNAAGSELFERITQDPNYYPTHAETEILKRFSSEIAAQLANNTAIVELGSGSSVKTRHLLTAIVQHQGKTLFCPIDISGDFLQENVKRLSADYPDLDILGVIADYYVGLAALADEIRQPKLLLWLGSDIGHADPATAAMLLRDKMLSVLQPGDKLLIGIDLKKAAEPIHRAYGCPGDNDPLRYEFNCNALRHINQKLGGNFVTDNFQRYCFYNESAGRLEIYLKSVIDQQVTLEALGQTFAFKAGELIRIHFAYKYDQNDIQQLGKAAGLRLEQQWLDAKGWYSLNLFAVGAD
jgi:dimethylhistidine N-methyltransferase